MDKIESLRSQTLIDLLLQFWFCVTHEENWNIILEKGIWGVSQRNKNTIYKLKRGDMLVFYVIPKRICGIFEVVSEPFESHEEIFGWGEFGRKELFPYRVKVKNILIPKDPVNIESLIEKLDFIKNKYLWSIHLKRAMQLISKTDYELIHEACRKADRH